LPLPRNPAVLDHKIAPRDIEFLRRLVEQRLACRRAGLPDLDAAVLDREAAEGGPLIRSEQGIASPRASRACIGTPSSSAAICVSAVSVPVPRSTLPEYTVTTPLLSMATKPSTRSEATVFGPKVFGSMAASAAFGASA